jgi:hypothetical protein
MGYGFYINADGRPAGYGVLATCDRRGCAAEIDRGLAYLCGDTPHGPLDAAPGCGFYFCGDHLAFVGPRGGCGHRQRRAWGRTLACMAADDDTDATFVCLYRAGHGGVHAWADPAEARA